MTSTTNPAANLRRIAELVEKAGATPDLPASLKSVLSEIATLANEHAADTPEPSDIPRTENQSL